MSGEVGIGASPLIQRIARLEEWVSENPMQQWPISIGCYLLLEAKSANLSEFYSAIEALLHFELQTSDKAALRGKISLYKGKERTEVKNKTMDKLFLLYSGIVDLNFSPQIPPLQAPRRRREDAVRINNLKRQVVYWKKRAKTLSARKGCNSRLQKKLVSLKASHKKTLEQQKVFDEEVSNGRYPVSLKSGRKKYSNAFFLLVANLHDNNVADDKINAVVGSFSDFFQISIDELPHPTTYGNFAVSMLHLARQQVLYEIDAAIARGTTFCVMSDETTDEYKKLQQYQLSISDKSHPIVVSLCIVPDKSAETSLKAFISALERIITTDTSSSTSVNKILVQTVAAVGDNASTQFKFARLFSQAREGVLATTVEDWDTLDSEEQERYKQFDTISCLLHVIANMAKTVTNSLSQYEADLKGLNKKEEASVKKFLTTVDGFFVGSNCGRRKVYPKFKSWLRQNALEFEEIPRFLGHRWNIIFVIADKILKQKQLIIDFIAEFYINEGSKNIPELIGIHSSLNDENILMQLTLLQRLSKIVTCPLIRMVETVGKYVDAIPYFEEMLTYFQDCEKEPQLAYQNNTLPLSDFMKDSSVPMVNAEPKLLAATKYTMDALAKYFEHVLKICSNNAEANCESAPASNRAVESGFGLNDFYSKRAPNMKLTRKEGALMCKRNNTATWIRSLSQGEQERRINEARKALNCIKKSEREIEEEVSRETLKKMYKEKEEGIVKSQRAERRAKRRRTEEIDEIELDE